MKNKINGKLHPSRLRALLVGTVLVTGMGLLATTASATAVLAGSVGGGPSGAAHVETFDSLTPGSSNTAVLGNGLSVSFLPDGKAVKGAHSGEYAAPVLTSGSGASFGSQADGLDTTTYLSSGGPHGSATLSFTGDQNYLGLLWGSVDSYNSLTFYRGAASVARFTGTDVGASAGAGNCIGGNQQSHGTCYVNINFLEGSFDRVVATSSAYAFEFDNVAFSALPLKVPEPGTAGVFLLGLLLVGSAYQLKARRA